MWLYSYFWIRYNSFKTESHGNGVVPGHSQVADHLISHVIESWEGAGFAAKIDGKMDADFYRSILNEDLMKCLEWYGDKVEDIIFQQDNDPKHKSKHIPS
jgi:hypothetical protein